MDGDTAMKIEKMVLNDHLKVKKLHEDAIIPNFAHDSDAGMDISSVEDLKIPARGYRLIKTGIAFGIPQGYELQIRSRSGLALKGIQAHFGTIDEEYVGEIGVVLYNHSSVPFKVEKGMRIAQVVIKKVERLPLEEVTELGETARGENGFGSTGIK